MLPDRRRPRDMFSRQPKTDLWYRRFVPVLLAVSLIGLASARAAAQDVQGPRRRMGEAFTWNMRILGLFDAGRARLAIAPPSRNGSALQVNVVGEAEATGLVKALTGLHDDYRLILDANTLLPRKMEITESGLNTRTVVLQLDGRRFDILARRPGAERRLNGFLPSEPLEPVAVLLLLRAARLEAGDKLELILIDGTNFYQGTIDVQRREELKSAMGTQSAIRLLCQGQRVDDKGRKMGRPPRQATLWLSDDAYRLPLRIEAQTDYGTGEFELTSYEPARRPIPIPKRMIGVTETLKSAAPPARQPAPPAPAPVPAPAPAPPPAQPGPAAAPELPSPPPSPSAPSP